MKCSIHIVFNFCGLLLLLFFSSCSNDEATEPFICPSVSSVIGEWNWNRTVAGFTGTTRTPESENLTKKLEIDEIMFREYINDSLVQEMEYEIKFTSSISDTLQFESDSSEYELIVFESGLIYWILYMETEMCFNQLESDGDSMCFESICE